ncbi:MAG: hypothetical protein ACRDI2_19825, partial [Chloroflexota bacterium]
MTLGTDVVGVAVGGVVVAVAVAGAVAVGEGAAPTTVYIVWALSDPAAAWTRYWPGAVCGTVNVTLKSPSRRVLGDG